MNRDLDAEFRAAAADKDQPQVAAWEAYLRYWRNENGLPIHGSAQ